MELVFCSVGKLSADYAVRGIDEYLSRIRRYVPVRTLHAPEERQTGRYSKAHRVDREGEGILRRLEGVAQLEVVALDVGGKALSSTELAKMVRRVLYEERRALGFVVGGPDGLSSAVLTRADRTLSLSKMTLPHDMACLILVEQVYRSLTLISRHPYAR